MLKFDKLKHLLELKQMSKMRLRHEYGVNINQLNKYLSSGLSGGLIDNLCHALDCQPGDIMEWVPDNPDE